MIVKEYESRELWLADRENRITGTKLKELIVRRGNTPKIAFYQLIADRIALPADGELPMERGLRLEEEALDMFAKETGKEIDKRLIICTREDNENIAYSPDGLVVGEPASVEVKCLNSAAHIKAYLTQEVPAEYREQILQPFIVDDGLTTNYMVFYDPRLLYKSMFYFTIKRDQAKVDEYLELERRTLEEVNRIANSLIEL